jgi:DNA-binding MarR family transcriptional regulator
MVSSRSDVAAAEVALERLFRLTVSRKMYARQSAAVGAVVTRAGYAILRSLDEAGSLPMGELARRCSMDPATAARQVRALEEDDLVERRAAEGDARVSVVTATPAGHAVYQRIVEVRTTHLEEVLAGWSDADRAALAHLVDRLVDDLKSVPFRPTVKERT